MKSIMFLAKVKSKNPVAATTGSINNQEMIPADLDFDALWIRALPENASAGANNRKIAVTNICDMSVPLMCPCVGERCTNTHQTDSAVDMPIRVKPKGNLIHAKCQTLKLNRIDDFVWITAAITEPERQSKLQFARASPASRASHCYPALGGFLMNRNNAPPINPKTIADKQAKHRMAFP